jgi:DNA gyrase subunit A
MFVSYTVKNHQFKETSKGRGIISYQIVDAHGNKRTISALAHLGMRGKIKSAEETTEDKPKEQAWQYLFMATKNGIVKKTPINNFEKIRTTGLIAIRLDDNDELEWVKPTTGNNDILLITKKGRSIRFDEKDVVLNAKPKASIDPPITHGFVLGYGFEVF